MGLLHHHTDKAVHYAQLLDEARCSSDWAAVPELLRKVRKHAPDRTCLTSAAELDQQITLYKLGHKPTIRPGTATNKTTANGHTQLETSQLLVQLMGTLDTAPHPDDVFEARTTAGWLDWVEEKYETALETLPEPDQRTDAEGWTAVCGVKSAYLRADCQAKQGNRVAALATLESALPAVSRAKDAPSSQKELRYWTELLLTNYCLLFTQALDAGEVSLEDANALASFRAWADFWQGSRFSSVTGGYGSKDLVPRRRIWSEYYSLLSIILQQDLDYPPVSPTEMGADSSAAAQLTMELKKTEAAYNSLLLNETRFPRAEEQREEMEAFVTTLTQNWAILSGPGWNDSDLGPGGKESLSRGVLDMLYRAATKTFHSTAILRHIFTLHLAVAEFDLAFKAFDSYLSIVKKGKARLEKTAEVEPSLDTDETVMETMSVCISALCRYGGRDAAERAKDLSVDLERWAVAATSAATQNGATRAVSGSNGQISGVKSHVPLRTLALSWQAIGLAQAQWARMTHASSSRSDIQRKAMQCLQKSLLAEYGCSTDVRSIYALSLLLAEQRQLTAAINLVKSALSAKEPDADTDDRQTLYHGSFWRQRSLLSLWHLLALLLSARQDYTLAARTCECAFEQFQDPEILFGRQDLYQSEHLDEKEKAQHTHLGLVDEMDDFEKESMLEVKMTQLAIVEIVEGPEVAVNASLELLSLFGRLFGEVQAKTTTSPAKGTLPPKTSGTSRTVRGSLFGGSKSNRHSMTDGNLSNTTTSLASRPRTMQTAENGAAPSINVTHENGVNGDQAQASPSPRRSGSARGSLRRNRSGSNQSQSKTANLAPPPRVPALPAPTIVDGESFFTPMGENFQASNFFSSTTNGASSISRALSYNQTPAISRQVSRTDAPLSSISKELDYDAIASHSAAMYGAVLPLTQFTKSQEMRRRMSLLIGLWVMIAGFYRRAAMFEEAEGALSEAQKLVQSLEADLGKDTSGEISLRDAGWAGKKSVEELWGDVFSEMAQLSLSRENMHAARADFEAALTHYPDHAAASIGLSNILLDIYSQKLRMPAVLTPMTLVGGTELLPGTSQTTADLVYPTREVKTSSSSLPSQALGLNLTNQGKLSSRVGHHQLGGTLSNGATPELQERTLPPAYKASSIPLADRLATRDRAYGLLSGLTKLGTSWNDPNAWFAMARAHEDSGQLDKAKDALWWCIELEEAKGVRDWRCTNSSNGGYVL